MTIYRNNILLIKEIISFKDLEENWDSYGANKISHIAKINAIDLLLDTLDITKNKLLLEVSPFPDGKINFN